MAAYQGTYYAISIKLKSSADGEFVDVTGWEFKADIRLDRRDTETLLELTTSNGGFVVTDGPGGKFEFRLTAEQTAALPLGKLVFDVLRTDVDPGPVYVFGASFRVKQPVTRDG